MKHCHKCKSGRIERATLDSTYTFEGLEVVVTSENWQRCADCGEAVISYAELGRVERAAMLAVAASGVRTGETFRFMRKALGLTAKEAAEVFEVDPVTVSRWETGDRPVSRAAWIALSQLARLPKDETERAVESLRSPPPHNPAGERVRVGAA